MDLWRGMIWLITFALSGERSALCPYVVSSDRAKVKAVRVSEASQGLDLEEGMPKDFLLQSLKTLVTQVRRFWLVAWHPVVQRRPELFITDPTTQRVYYVLPFGTAEVGVCPPVILEDYTKLEWSPEDLSQIIWFDGVSGVWRLRW